MTKFENKKYVFLALLMIFNKDTKHSNIFF